ncbi:hypothetical protein [Gordonia hydrophobica]|uniref:TetR family transcriptional regulator n=1 Tax=Gordonia hydrophobica TaxID=40516 RepID=A0ABZ2U4S3_9ACTN|nr:hypothetical protein [Gordonia hydrophobica]MBM7368241.1 hypothetical protein [Gordonia hydrophobica]
MRGDDIDRGMRVRLGAIAQFLQDIAADMIEASPHRQDRLRRLGRHAVDWMV